VRTGLRFRAASRARRHSARTGASSRSRRLRASSLCATDHAASMSSKDSSMARAGGRPSRRRTSRAAIDARSCPANHRRARLADDSRDMPAWCPGTRRCASPPCTWRSRRARALRYSPAHARRPLRPHAGAP
jgi:hypothetical protein